MGISDAKINDKSVYKAFLRKIEKLMAKLRSKFQAGLIVAWFLTQNTLTVVAMFLIVFSPFILLPFLMGHPPPYCYIAYAVWMVFIAVTIILAALVGYLRETRQG